MMAAVSAGYCTWRELETTITLDTLADFHEFMNMKAEIDWREANSK